MKIAIIRVGVDAGPNSGSMQGPLFKDGSFEFIPIPQYNAFNSRYTYGNLIGRHGKPLVHYFPYRRQHSMATQAVHNDPDWNNYTYGTDTCGAQARLRYLEKNDILIFTCGLQGWDFKSEPAMYLAGYFVVETAGILPDFSQREIRSLFKENAHIRYIREENAPRGGEGWELILVKGSSKSRLLKKAVKISTMFHDSAGRPIKVLSPKMIKVFGSFGGRTCFQRSSARWIVDPKHVKRTADLLRRLQ